MSKRGFSIGSTPRTKPPRGATSASSFSVVSPSKSPTSTTTRGSCATSSGSTTLLQCSITAAIVTAAFGSEGTYVVSEHAVGAVVEDEHAAVRQPGRTLIGPAQQGRLGECLRLDRGGREGGGLNDAREGGTAGGRIEQMMRRPALRVEPAALSDAARGDAARGEPELMQVSAPERVIDAHRSREAGAAADPQVADAVDRERVETGEAVGDHVREQALRDAAAVERDARRPHDRPARSIDGDLAPAPLGARPRGLPPGRQPEAEILRDRGRQVPAIARGLDLADERRVDKAAGPPGGVDSGRDEPAQDAADANAPPGVGVQQR